MSAFVHDASHIDVCVDAAKYVVDQINRDTAQVISQLSSTELGWTMLRANIESVIARHGIREVSGQLSRKSGEIDWAVTLAGYTHRPNVAVVHLWQPRKLATYIKAIDSLIYQSCEVEAWDATPMGRLLADVRRCLSSLLLDALAVEGSWAWLGIDRGALPCPPLGRERQGWMPPVEIVQVVDCDGRVTLDAFVGGESCPKAQVRSVDAGAGWTWPDWVAHRDGTLAAATPAARAVLIDAFADPGGGEHVTGREGRDWLDGSAA